MFLFFVLTDCDCGTFYAHWKIGVFLPSQPALSYEHIEKFYKEFRGKVWSRKPGSCAEALNASMFGDSSIFRQKYVLSRLTFVSIHKVHARKRPNILKTLLLLKDCFCNIPHLNASIKLSYQWGLNTVRLSCFVVRLRFEVTIL